MVNLLSRRKDCRRKVEDGKGERVSPDLAFKRLDGLLGFHDGQASCSVRPYATPVKLYKRVKQV